PARPWAHHRCCCCHNQKHTGAARPLPKASSSSNHLAAQWSNARAHECHSGYLAFRRRSTMVSAGKSRRFDPPALSVPLECQLDGRTLKHVDAVVDRARDFVGQAAESRQGAFEGARRFDQCALMLLVLGVELLLKRLDLKAEILHACLRSPLLGHERLDFP